MGEVTIIGVDLAKNVFQLHGAASDGSVVFRKKLSRPQFTRFMAEQPPCRVAMEACASSHHWARELARHGHEVRLIAPHYVKPFIKRQKNDAADAEAIVEAALRPTMRFVEPKTADQQARAIAFRTREQLVKQRTETNCAFRRIRRNAQPSTRCARISTSSATSRLRASGSSRVWRGSSKIPKQTCRSWPATSAGCSSNRSRT